MIAEMRRLGGRSGVSCVSIRSQCLRTPCMSGAALGDLRRGFLRASLNCLAKVIEQLLSSLTTFSTNFSWRLPRGLYPFEEIKGKSSSFTVEDQFEKKLIEGPMKVLDDLRICKQRALLRLQPHIQTQPTLMQKIGKDWWRRKRENYAEMVEKAFKGLKAQRSSIHKIIEHDVALTYIGRKLNLILRGKVDVVCIVSLELGEVQGGTPFTVVLEFTMHENVDDVIDRVIAYSASMYSSVGYYVVPVVIVMKDYEKDLVEDVFIVKNEDKYGILKHLLNRFKQLEELLTSAHELSLKRPRDELCSQCDVDLRRFCPLVK